MNTKKFLVSTLAAAVTAGGLLALPSQAAEGARLARRAPGPLLERAKEKLGLTDSQATQIKAVLKAKRETLTGLISKLHGARVGLRGAIQAADATEASVRVAAAKVAAVEADLAVEPLKLYGKISPILTAEQREKVSEIQARLDDLVDQVVNRLDKRLAE
jgi:Spy/CpxP family protein refolding chaperone